MGSGSHCNVPAGWVLQNRYIVESDLEIAIIWNDPIMVLERIANPSIGENRFLSSSLSHSAKFSYLR